MATRDTPVGTHHTTQPALFKATATKILSANPGRIGVIIQNQSGSAGFAAAVDVYYGGPTVTNDAGANPGLLLKGGQTIPTTYNDTLCGGEIWAVLANAGTDNTKPLCVDEVY